MNKKIFDPKKYGMEPCPSCDARGFVQNPNRHCCPNCGGFGSIKIEAEQDTNISAGNHKLPKAPEAADW